MILGDMIERNACCFPEHPAVLFEGRSLSHRDYARRVKQLINALAAKGCSARVVWPCCHAIAQST
jgi:non-ribosomal peptide synthetase component E (peptide arylation enzyme)